MSFPSNGRSADLANYPHPPKKKKPAAAVSNRPNLASLKRKESLLESSPVKGPQEITLEKQISQMMGRPYVGKR